MTVYLVRAGENGPVKIGRTANVPARMQQLQVGHPEPLALIRTVDGGAGVETWFHRKFSADHIRGEWFRFSPDMTTVLPPQPSLKDAEPRFRFPIEYIRKNLLRSTQAEIAAIANTSQASVSRWESGELEPDLDELTLIRTEAIKRGLSFHDSVFFEVPAEVASS